MCKRDKKFGRLKGRLEGLAFQKVLTFSFIISLFMVSFLNTASSDTQPSIGGTDDIIKVEVTENEIVGLNTLTNVRVVERLKDGETVTSALSKGKVGAVLTDRRLLGFNATNNTWSSFETFFNEDIFPNEIKVSSSMAVAMAKRRIFAYTSISNDWKLELVPFLEHTLSSDINDNLIFVRTSARVVAFSFHKQRWFSQNLYDGETIIHSATGENFVTVTTKNTKPAWDNRILTFDAKNGKWIEERLRRGVDRKTTDMSSPSEYKADTAPEDKSAASEAPDSKS
ncbi:MAG: hypothetical protein ACUZ77_12065 [Candidatus Brocadiales bacterium]